MNKIPNIVPKIEKYILDQSVNDVCKFRDWRR